MIRRPCLPSLPSCAQTASRADVLAAWRSVGVDLGDSPVSADILATDAGARNFLRGFLRERDRRIERGERRTTDAREVRAVAVTRAFVAFRAACEVAS